MLVAGSCAERDLYAIVEQAVTGGLRLFQLRDRRSPVDTQRHLIEALQRRFAELDLLINNQPQLARQVGTGLHLPETTPLPADWPLSRRWGRSVHGVQAARRAADEGAHYIIVGTIFPTTSKPGHPGSGVALLRQVCTTVNLPVFAIGGICASNVRQIREAGAYGAAIQGAILNASDPRTATEELLALIQA